VLHVHGCWRHGGKIRCCSCCHLPSCLHERLARMRLFHDAPPLPVPSPQAAALPAASPAAAAASALTWTSTQFSAAMPR
jgi:hypothetical protein